ncbi:sugar phosphate isomerase/epimerase [Actinoplanes lutulentus]|uniref:Xylose isomerase-like TIM barrel protein n=1 Tax=Actinoplanes lutulentus TaxID=1287878 RepID=A0A327ZF94_9ACTN|nr:TIM barrel protein [Actinoplanes lutulentus]MBB2941960.1 sugar phosphate isomerase/epimerase [Actinoplanes lutulentus]RAK39872.1 xylose isomerase-like TIM barrel protein [Actinoplanes lutulentus]
MRLRHPSGRIVHLSCGISLVHAETPTDGLERLEAAAGELRTHFGTGLLGVALRLSYPLAAALADDGRARTRLRAELDAKGLEVVTLSGVPDAEGGGEDTTADDVESDPRSPGDWSTPSRVRHTLALARILVDLLPFEEVRGAIATCGLGPAAEWDENHQKAGARHISRLSGGLADLAWRVGRAVRCGFEPGPGLVLDSPEATVAALTRVDKDRLGVCLDLATVIRDWPDPEAGIDRITDAGLSVITARITDPASDWQPILRHLLAADTARTEYVDVDTPAGAADLPYVLEELTAIGLVPEQQPCTAP